MYFVFLSDSIAQESCPLEIPADQNPTVELPSSTSFVSDYPNIQKFQFAKGSSFYDKFEYISMYWTGIPTTDDCPNFDVDSYSKYSTRTTTLDGESVIACIYKKVLDKTCQSGYSLNNGSGMCEIDDPDSCTQEDPDPEPTPDVCPQDGLPPDIEGYGVGCDRPSIQQCPDLSYELSSDVCPTTEPNPDPDGLGDNITVRVGNSVDIGTSVAEALGDEFRNEFVDIKYEQGRIRSSVDSVNLSVSDLNDDVNDRLDTLKISVDSGNAYNQVYQDAMIQEVLMQGISQSNIESGIGDIVTAVDSLKAQTITNTDNLISNQGNSQNLDSEILGELEFLNNTMTETGEVAELQIDGLSSYWESDYPDGLAGEFEKILPQMQGSHIFSFLESFEIETTSTLPDFGVCLDFGLVNFGCMDLPMPPAYVLNLMRLIVLLTAGITARNIIMGP